MLNFLDLKKEYLPIKKEIDAAIKRVVDNTAFIGGPEVAEFENAVAKFCGVKYAMGVNSGTDALLLALKALDIGAGDLVITTPFTFIATAEIIANLGATPIFSDIEADSFNLDCAKLEKTIANMSVKERAKLKAIIPVHLFGQMADMASIMKIAKKYKLAVIEDAAQCFGAEMGGARDKSGKKSGAIGTLGCFSFFPSKNLASYGDGGMIVTNDAKLAEKIQLFKNHGSSKKEKYNHLCLGMNSRLDAIQAAVLRVKLKYLPARNKKRQALAKYYQQKLQGVGDLILPAVKSEKGHSFNQYTLRTGQRDQLQTYLTAQGVPTNIYYAKALHQQPAFKYLGYKAGAFPVAEKAAREVISISLYPELPRADQDLIIKHIKDFFKK